MTGPAHPTAEAAPQGSNEATAGPWRILVSGSRDWPRERAVEVRDRIVAAAAGHDPAEVVIVHGGARGADAWAALTAERLGYRAEVHRADWDRHGRAAGMIRNREMVAAGADVCLGFPLGESRGTRGCLREAERAGIPVHTVEHGPDIATPDIATPDVAGAGVPEPRVAVHDQHPEPAPAPAEPAPGAAGGAGAGGRGDRCAGGPAGVDAGELLVAVPGV